MRIPWRLVCPSDMLNDTEFPGYRDSEGRHSCRIVHTPTRFGKVIYNLPGIVSLVILGLIYIVYGLIWICGNFCFGAIDVLLQLFTEKWKDIEL